MPHSAEFAGSALELKAVVNIKVPQAAPTLTRVGGTETMTLDNFDRPGPDASGSLAKAAKLHLRVGGTLNVAANQAEGVYVGTFDVTVQYP